MSVYQAHLTEAFAIGVIGPRQWVMDCVEFLCSPEFREMQSSFAVTSDTSSPDELCLWLSDVSRERLYEAKLAQRGAFG